MLLLLQETLEYMEEHYKYMRTLNKATIALQKKYKRLHYKITKEILNLIRALYYQQICQNVKTEFNEHTDELHRADGIIVSMPWPENIKQESESINEEPKTNETMSSSNTKLSEYDQRIIKNGNILQPDMGDKSSFTDGIQKTQSTCIQLIKYKNKSLKQISDHNYAAFTDQLNEKQKCTGRVNEVKVDPHAAKKSNELMCDRCEIQFFSYNDIRRHNLATHTDGKALNYAVYIDEKTFKEHTSCLVINKNVCKVYKRKSRVKTPVVKTFACKKCDKVFYSNANLKRHIPAHYDEKKYKCQKCEKTFSHEAILKTHMLVHTSGKYFECEICENTFTAAPSLQRHLLVHSGEKPFHCEIFGKKFSQKPHLKRHMVVHTGERRFKCEICEKKFTENSSLKIHRLSRHAVETRVIKSHI